MYNIYEIPTKPEIWGCVFVCVPLCALTHAYVRISDSRVGVLENRADEEAEG